MAQDRTSANSRRIKNFIIAPEKQLRLVFFSVGIGLMFFIGVFAFQLWMFSNLVGSLIAFVPESSTIVPMVSDSVRWSWLIFATLSVFFGTILTMVTIVVSHRIYGPLVAIRKHITAIRAGEFDHRTHLRKHDEFQDVAHDLNQLSEQLAEKKS